MSWVALMSSDQADSDAPQRWANMTKEHSELAIELLSGPDDVDEEAAGADIDGCTATTDRVCVHETCSAVAADLHHAD